MNFGLLLLMSSIYALNIQRSTKNSKFGHAIKARVLKNNKKNDKN